MRPSTNSFKRLLDEFRELRRFQRLKPCDRDIVFYAESESYFIYFEPFIKHLIQDHNRKICYVTSSSSDPILQNKSEEIRTFCIGEKSIRTIFFASLNVNILVMTLLDLNRFHIKRSKYPVHYVFVPHSMVSTHMAFRKGAHNDFDTIFCVGPHHVTELREAEEKYDLTPRTLVENGYARVDTIYDESKAMKLRSSPTGNSPLRILIAPSWGNNCILELAGEDLVKVLLDSDYHVTVRTHRHTRRFS